MSREAASGWAGPLELRGGDDKAIHLANGDAADAPTADEIWFLISIVVDTVDGDWVALQPWCPSASIACPDSAGSVGQPYAWLDRR